MACTRCCGEHPAARWPLTEPLLARDAFPGELVVRGEAGGVRGLRWRARGIHLLRKRQRLAALAHQPAAAGQQKTPLPTPPRWPAPGAPSNRCVWLRHSESEGAGIGAS